MMRGKAGVFLSCVLSLRVMAASPFPALAQAQPKTPAVRDPKSLYASASKAVVTIVVLDRAGQQVATGSGVVVSPDGHIVTNYHVVAGGTFFEIRFPVAARITEPVPGRPIGCSPDRDLAMLAITPDRPLAFARKAATLPGVGERVLAIGSPLGLEGTLSEGVVSQLRELDGTPLIQTTAQVSPGSSGGGLFLYSGDLVGITAMSLKGGQSLNFAVAVDALRDLAPCKSFPRLAAEGSGDVESPTPSPTMPPCLADLKLGPNNVDYGSFPLPWAETRGIVKNIGCGVAAFARVRMTILQRGKFQAAETCYVDDQYIAGGHDSTFKCRVFFPSVLIEGNDYYGLQVQTEILPP